MPFMEIISPQTLQRAKPLRLRHCLRTSMLRSAVSPPSKPLAMLRKHLVLNGVFSILSGLAMVFLSNYFMQLIGFENDWILPLIGFNLIGFGAFVLYASRALLKKHQIINLISALDGMWVVGSFILLILAPFGFPTEGRVLIALAAAWIAYLGIQQYRHNK